jgi:hypothetical protein
MTSKTEKTTKEVEYKFLLNFSIIELIFSTQVFIRKLPKQTQNRRDKRRANQQLRLRSRE